MSDYPNGMRHSQNGSTLVVTLMITMLMLVMAMALIGFAYFTSEQSYFYHDYAQALYTAEAGLNRLVVSSVAGSYIYLTDSVGNNYCNFYAFATTAYGTNTIYATSTGIVTRIRSVHRIVQVAMIPGDSPWNHMLWVGGNTVPAGSDPSSYPAGYNSTTNGPVYNKQYIPRYTLDAEGKWTPYYEIATSGTPNVYMNSTTVIGSPTGLTYSWSGNVCTMRGTFTGVLYIEGTLNLTNALTVNGSLIVVGGNININKTTLTVNQDSTHMNYVSLACIDTTATDDFTTWTSDVNAGNINQGTGNSTLTVDGGAVYCSNIYAKNGQGTNINGVVVCMGANINGFPSGDYLFDPTVSQYPPLGFDLSRFNTLRQIASKSWRELPYSF
ncbi:MAG: hypothetical protein ACE14V_00990 [bacterium]